MEAEKPLRGEDVRMRGFAHRTTVADALRWLDKQLKPIATEPVALADAAGRVLATDVISEVSVPPFPRSMMDGFALHAADTLGASAYNRLPMSLVGEVLPGTIPSLVVKPGEAVRIMTGARMPDGADAVLPVELTELENDRVVALDAVSPGKHVGRIGEDVSEGATVLHAGRRLRPQDLGVLSSIGASQIEVFRRPTVRVLVTGNELLPPGSRPCDNKIVDANSPMLAALVERDGGELISPEMVPDDAEAIRQAMHQEADVILVSGGSSVGKEDFAPLMLARHGELAIHGIAMRPSSPAGMGRWGNRLVFLLPGNPVSCLCAYDFFAGRAIRVLGGRPENWPYTRSRCRLVRKLISKVGRLDYARVRRVDEQMIEPLAISGASILSSTTRADGFVIVPEDSEGIAEDGEVDVFLYDRE